MYYTHHFAHRETFRRACDWLDRFGFHPENPRAEADGAPWLALTIDAGSMAEVELLVNAVEAADPEGWPSFWDEARLARWTPTDATAEAHNPPEVARRSAVGWHPVDTPGSLDVDAIREAMGR